MTNDYCCQNLDQLNDGYVHDGLIYLQRLYVKTDIHTFPYPNLLHAKRPDNNHYS